MTPLVRPEHIAELVSKANSLDARHALERLSASLAALTRLGAEVDRQCIANRLKAGEAVRKVQAPRFAQEMSNKASAEITKQVLRQVRRAPTASEAAKLLAERMRPDVEFLRQGTTDQRILTPSREAIQNELNATLAFQEQLLAFSRAFHREEDPGKGTREA